MRFLQRMLIAGVGSIVLSLGAAVAHASSVSSMGRIAPASHSYSGRWPVTVSHAARGNGRYCLTLTDDGSEGWRHSGAASLVGQGSNLPYGIFQVIDHTLVATIEQQGYSQNAGLLFIGPANNGNIANGVFEQVYGGEDSDSGELTFGMKGGC